MAGLIKNELASELLTELSWMKRVIGDLCERTGLETYHTALLKYRIEPEEEKALDQFLFLHWKTLDDLSINEIEEGVAKIFYETTRRQWSKPEDILKTLVDLWKAETKLQK